MIIGIVGALDLVAHLLQTQRWRELAKLIPRSRQDRLILPAIRRSVSPCESGANRPARTGHTAFDSMNSLWDPRESAELLNANLHRLSMFENVNAPPGSVLVSDVIVVKFINRKHGCAYERIIVAHLQCAIRPDDLILRSPKCEKTCNAKRWKPKLLRIRHAGVYTVCERIDRVIHGIVS